MGTVVVRYRTKSDSSNENQRLIEQVFAELASKNPDGIQYSAYRLDDDVFLHIAEIPGDDNPLSSLAAFKQFQLDITDRCAPGEGPDVKHASLVGSYDGLKIGT